MIPLTHSELATLAALAPARSDFHAARRHSKALDDTGDVFARARRYLATIPGAVSGDRGHDRTYRAACKLVIGFALTPDAAFPLLAEWNSTCVPPWEDDRLWRKLREADRLSGPRGGLLLKEAPPPGVAKSLGGTGTGAIFRNFRWDEIPDGETMRKVRRGRRGEDLVTELLDYTGGWPRRSGKMLFARDKLGGITWIKSTAELFAWIDWQYGIDNGGGFEWATGPGCLTQSEFLDSCRIHCEHWEQVELFPHDPPIPGHFYHHPELPPHSEGELLTDLVRRFQPYSPEDEDLIRLFFVTQVWGGPPRKRPIFLFEPSPDGEGQGSGKTTVAILGSRLVGDFVSVSPKEQIRDIQTRLLSPEALTRRIVLIDNLKALRFSDSDIEGLITTPIISGRQMYTGEGRRPNTLTWVITANKPSLSKDLSQRSIIIRVAKPTYTPEWERSVIAFIEEHRWGILADCIRELRLPSRLPADFKFTRWAEWEQDVLSKAPDPAALVTELARRATAIDDDAEISGMVRDAVRTLLQVKGFDPERDTVLIPVMVLVSEVVKQFAGDRMSPASGMKWLYLLNIANLSKHHTDKPYRGAIWHPNPQTKTEAFLKWTDRFGTSGLSE